MKNILLIPSTILLAAVMSPLADAQQISEEEFAKRVREAQANNPLANARPAEGADPTKENRPSSIIANSDIISFNGLTVLVPKGAILATPTSLSNRIGTHNRGHRIVPWRDFHLANPGWITTIEVTPAQASGREGFSESVAERIEKATKLIVATYQGGPISVLPVQDNSGEETGEPSAESP